MFRWSSRVSLFAAVAALGVAGFLWWSGSRSRALEPQARFESTEAVVEGLRVGESRTVHFRITNRGRHPIRVLGMSGECSQCACLLPKADAELTIAPGETAVWECEVRAHHAGPISSGASLYIDDGGAREVRLTVSGTVLPAEEPAHAKD